MHPAPSIILFTSLSGLGFGLLFFLGLGYPQPTGWVGFVFFLIAYFLAAGGLLLSTFHLGHPERAWRAMSQWQSSWLSREGVCAVAALVVMGLYALGLVFFDSAWQPLGWIGALLSLATVGTTSMIYGQLKTVPRWNMLPLTPALFLSLSLAGGALLAGQVTWATGLLVLAALVQVAWWVLGDKALVSSGSDLASATGLGAIGDVRAFEPPHTGTNYLLSEMVHVVGRAHALKLRAIAFGLGFVLPVLFLLLPFNHLWGVLAVLAHVAGVLVSRWLFFAEAEHVVGIYYGKR
ncbi:dimethyl sulfoxide reductase anchor subunit [Primorskyibacter aestuariivivens]|uniref:dimethyl sulfoxide reductase anchor subunit family protein n=1 Tax=Primorskyibacter aestuariivivens TaxID=1888912 RepID=UPI002300F4C4|nr:DmsC/YnfH family molybdoenzyme membrane anchor subunit [Primorskyibacter aestuariivivens]MDA7427759.1 dimethyl sulfoxide reductase anchor subunit [Primorskyibacter aestuariivivens]